MIIVEKTEVFVSLSFDILNYPKKSGAMVKASMPKRPVPK
jgi:hypothetical protein